MKTNTKQATFFVLLVWAVLASVAAQPHKIFADQGQHERPAKKLDPTQLVLSPSAFSYQGQLKESSVPASGTYDFQFTLYTAQIGGDHIGSVVKDDIVVTSGSFAVVLDFGSGAFTGSDGVWMEVAVRSGDSTDAYTVLSPRQRLTPTPYAILAQADTWSLIGVPVGFAGSVDGDLVTVNRIADGQIVKSINSLKDDVTLAAGTNVAITPSGNTLTISAHGGAGWVNDKGVVRLTADASNVGIGIREPTAKLDVDGDIRARGAIRSGNSMTFDGSDHTITATTVADQPFSRQIRIGYKDTANPGPFSDIRVGIGTLTPLRAVDVLNNDQAVLRLTTQSNAAGSVLELQNNLFPSTVLGAINFLEPNAGIGNLVGQISYLSPPTNAMTFRTNNAERVRITSSGSVGIGTTTPGNTLHVAGGVRVDTLANPTPTNTIPVCRNSSNDLSLCGGAAISWLVTGNAGTTPANFLGTLDNNFLAFRTNNLERMRISTGGDVGIGTTFPTETLHVAGRIRVDQLGSPGSEHLCLNGNVISSCSSSDSDARLKTSLMPLTNVLEKLANIRGVSFEWNDAYKSLGSSSSRREIGVIAQEVEAAFPELVTERDDGYKRVAYEKLTAVLVEAVKELKAENEALKQRIERLEKMMPKR